MTEKRFECDKGSRIIIDNETKLHYIMTLDWECSLITKLLNHFAEENEQLKLQNSTLMKEVAEYSRKAKELEKGDGTTEINISQNKRCGECAYFVRIYDGFCDLKKRLTNPSICSCDYWTKERIPNLNRRFE